MKSTWMRAFALLFAFTLIAAACGDDDDAADDQPVASGEADDGAAADGEAADGEMAELADIVDTAVASGEFPTLVAALEAADLVDTLKGDGPFTVLAPTEEAFAAALEALGVTADELLANPDLGSILTYHVIPGNLLAADVVGAAGTDVATVNGATVAITVDGDTVMVNDATVVQTDIMASNGVIHVIDTVLLP